MVPTGVVDQGDEPLPTVPAAAVPAPPAKTLRSRSSKALATPSDGDAPLPVVENATPESMETEAAGRQRRRRRRQRRKNSDVPVDNHTRIKRRVKNLLMKMRLNQNLLDAYSGEGWKGQSREKIRPERELQRATAQILHAKLALREAVHELDDLGLEGSLDENAFDAEGRIYHEEVYVKTYKFFCARCKSEEALIENDIILCDGACSRAFHQYCLDPPLATEDIPPGDEGWLCPVCECKMECIEMINGSLDTDFEVEDNWEKFFSEEAVVAAGGGTQEGAGGDFPSSDSEDDDYDPEGGENRANELSSKEAAVAAGGGAQEGAGGDFPSSDSEDDDYDPEGGQKLANSEEESESESEEGEDDGDDVKDGEDGEGSISGNDFRENEASSGPSDKDEQVPSAPINLKKLARKRKFSSGVKEESECSQSSDSDESDVSLFDEFKDGGAKLGLRRGDSQAEGSASDEEAMVIAGKRHRKAVDYKKLHDEMYGNTEIEDNDIVSEDDDWGPKRRRRRTIPDDPSRPRPRTIPDDPSRPRPRRIRRRKARASLGHALKGVDADGVPQDLPSTLQGEEAADTPGKEGEKRTWKRFPDTAVEALRRVVVVNALPSKPQKEKLAAELGLSYSQVHGWFKSQRHQALRKGLVRPKRPHLVPSSSTVVKAVNGVEIPASVEAVTGSTLPQNENGSKIYLNESLDEVQMRLLELQQSLDAFANAAVVNAGDRNIEVDNNFGNGGIGLPANENRVVYVLPGPEVKEPSPVSTHT